MPLYRFSFTWANINSALELRNKIYELVIPKGIFATHEPKFMYVNRQIRSECVPLFYGGNIFGYSGILDSRRLSTCTTYIRRVRVYYYADYPSRVGLADIHLRKNSIEVVFPGFAVEWWKERDLVRKQLIDWVKNFLPETQFTRDHVLKVAELLDKFISGTPNNSLPPFRRNGEIINLAGGQRHPIRLQLLEPTRLFLAPPKREWYY